MAAGDVESDLSAFQLEVARLFFALPASQGFLLAGGAALQHPTARPTEDLDFSPPPSAGRFSPRVTPWKPRPTSEAGPRSESTKATRSAGSSSAVQMQGSWLTWP